MEPDKSIQNVLSPNNVFSEIAMDHAQSPRNLGPLSSFNGHGRITGPCGDTMEFWVWIQEDRVEKVSFITDGCSSSHACGSMATCLVEKKSLKEALEISQMKILNALGSFPEESAHCALLSANTLKAACEDYLRNRERTAKCGSCSNASCSAKGQRAGESEPEFRERQKLQQRLCRIRRKIVVLSGKGGVGKSTVAVNLAVSLLSSGKKVGLMDVDIHGPSIPTMLGLEYEQVHGEGEELIPVEKQGLKVLSIGFFLMHQDNPVIWRGPRKMAVIRQFLRDGIWGDLDFLIVDSPPGTGDEPLSVVQLLEKVDGALVVTTPQKVAAVDVRKSISFCRELNVPIIGVIENMSGFACPHCGETTAILRTGGGKKMAEEMRVPFLGAIPIDPQIADACDEGESFISRYGSSPTAVAMKEIIRAVELFCK